MGRSLVGTARYCAEWQGGEAERNVPTLRFREAALNVMPAGPKFEDVCDVLDTELSKKKCHEKNDNHVLLLCELYTMILKKVTRNYSIITG